MAYGFVIDVRAPIEFYDALHAEVARFATGAVDGMLVHLGQETPRGFEVTEIWESKELCDRFNQEVGPALARLSGGRPPPEEPRMQEFEPRGLIVPAAHVVV